MNIRPIDLQVLIPRATDVAKISAVADQHATTQQQQLATQFQQLANERQQQVEASAHGEHSGKINTENLDQEQEKRKKTTKKRRND